MITAGQVVTIHYILRNADGDIVDQSEADFPLSYLHGANTIVPGLEAALEGKQVGDEIDVVIDAEDGYGEKLDDMLIELPRSEFGTDEELEVGMEFEMEVEGHDEIATIVELNDTTVIADFNHPLAGETLHFSVSILDIRNATEDEMAHGHAHGEGGHSHSSDH